VSIVDAQGRIIYNIKTVGRSKIIVPINDLPSGVYFVELNGKTKVRKKFVKQ
jgi:hypothetical protein